MAYVRKRTTKAGSVSTMLVEAYRDKNGHPRQRILANMHGEPDTLRALAKLAAMREALRQERDWLAQQAADASDWYAKNVEALSDEGAGLRCTFVSSGCIRLTRQDVIELCGRVSCGALAPR